MTNPLTIDIVRDAHRLREALALLLARQPWVTVDDLMQLLRDIARGGADDVNATSGERAIGLDAHDFRVTQREWEVIALIGDGLSNGEIAKEMHVAIHTVKTHVRNIMAKLRVRSRLQIAARVHREGLSLAMSA